MKTFMGCLCIGIACSMLIGCNNRIDTEALKLALKSDTLFTEYNELRDSVMLGLRSRYTSWERDLLQRKVRKDSTSLTAEEKAKLDDINQLYAVGRRTNYVKNLLEKKYPDLKKMASHERQKLEDEVRQSILRASNKLLDINALKLALKSDIDFIQYEAMRDSESVYSNAKLTYYASDMDSLLISASKAPLTIEGQKDLQTMMRRRACARKMVQLDYLLEKKYPTLKMIPVVQKSELYNEKGIPSFVRLCL